MLKSICNKTTIINVVLLLYKVAKCIKTINCVVSIPMYINNMKMVEVQRNFNIIGITFLEFFRIDKKVMNI